MQAQNVNFKGYNNVIGNYVPISNSSLSFIAMQLNNVGKADLEAFKSLQALGKKLGKNISGDILLINSYQAPRRPDMIEINGEEIVPALFLKRRDRKDTNFPLEEAFTMKAYTLIADLMKRLVFDTALSKNGLIGHVSRFVFESMSQNFPQDIVWHNFIEPSFYNRDVSVPAQKYLEIIDTDMKGYFD